MAQQAEMGLEVFEARGEAAHEAGERAAHLSGNGGQEFPLLGHESRGRWLTGRQGLSFAQPPVESR